jgi:hypothetical protein
MATLVRGQSVGPMAQVVYHGESSLLQINTAGFVHTDMDTEDTPGYDEVAHVHGVFSKHSLKEIRKQHPLFARGSDEKLNLLVS